MITSPHLTLQCLWKPSGEAKRCPYSPGWCQCISIHLVGSLSSHLHPAVTRHPSAPGHQWSQSGETGLPPPLGSKEALAKQKIDHLIICILNKDDITLKGIKIGLWGVKKSYSKSKAQIQTVHKQIYYLNFTKGQKLGKKCLKDSWVWGERM